MRTVYAIQLAVQPQPRSDAPICFKELVNAATDWVKAKYKQTWRTDISITDDAPCTPMPNHVVHARTRVCDVGSLFALDWTHPHDSDPGLYWAVTCLLAHDGKIAELSVILRLTALGGHLRPASFEVGRPRFVSEVLTKYKCHIDSYEVPCRPVAVPALEMADFVKSVLLSPARPIPVLVISKDPWSDLPLLDPAALQQDLLGFCQVHLLADKWASFKLTDCVGKHLSCFGGASRLYWPGLALNDDPYGHPLYMPDTIQRLAKADSSFGRFLFRKLTTIAAYRFAEGRVIRSVRRRIAEEAQNKVTALREAVAAGTLEKKKLEEELLTSLYQAEAQKEEIEGLKRDIETQRANCVACRDAMRVGPDVPAESGQEEDAETEDQLRTVHDALVRAERDFHGPLVFLDSARESAQKSVYKAPDRVYQALNALHEVATEWRNRGGRLGQSWKQALQSRGFDVHQVSQTSGSRWKEEYTFPYDGKSEFFSDHITLGAGQADTCCSIHWLRDDRTRVLVIGYCGEHLTNTKT